MFNFEAKNVDNRVVNGRSGCQDWLQQTILLGNTPLRFFYGATPANIGHPPKVGFTVLCCVRFACFWLLLPEALAAEAYHWLAESNMII